MNITDFNDLTLAVNRVRNLAVVIMHGKCTGLFRNFGSAEVTLLGNKNKCEFILYCSRLFVTLPSKEGEITPSRQKRKDFLCFALDFS